MSSGQAGGPEKPDDTDGGAFPYYSPAHIRAVLEERGGAPRKRWGQNFLIDPGWCRKLADLALRFPDGPLLEIGPGLGAITTRLVHAGRAVYSVEIDPILAQLLRELLAAEPGFHLENRDAREVLAELITRQGRLSDGAAVRVICGNLPYYISTDLLTAAVDVPGIAGGVFLLQLEFVERIAASHAASSLGVYLRNFGTWRAAGRVPAHVFYPRPGVDSAVVEFHTHPGGPLCDSATLEKVLRMSFGARRKKLMNSWKLVGRNLLELETLVAAARDAGIDPEKRAEEIPVELFFALTRGLTK